MKNTKRSFTLVEVLTAFFILTVAILGAVGMNGQFQRNSKLTSSLSIATRDLTAVMESLRAMDLDEIRAAQANPNFFDGLLSGQLTDQVVTLAVLNDDWAANPLRITVTVFWDDNGELMSRSLFSVFTDD